MKWLEDLIDEYPTNRTDSAIQRLASAFSYEDDALMEWAVEKYMKENQFFPKLSSMNPYVNLAKKEAGRFSTPQEARYDVMLNNARATGDFTAVDDAILRWETARGGLAEDDSMTINHAAIKEMANKTRKTISL